MSHDHAQGAGAPAGITGAWEQLTEGVWKQNPVFVMMLGMCPALAVTVSAINALSMGVDTLELATDDNLMDAILRFADLRKQRSRLANWSGRPGRAGEAAAHLSSWAGGGHA